MSDEVKDTDVVVEQPSAEEKKPDRLDGFAATLRRTKETFAKEIADLKSQLEASKAAGTSQPEDENDLAAQLKSYKKEFDKLSRQLEKEKAQAQAEKDRGEVFAALTEAGVMGTKVLYNHFTNEGLVRRNDEGEWVFGERNGVEKPLKEGLKDWLSTNEGKMFLPPSGATGSGAKPSQPVLPHKTSPATSKADRKAEAERQLLAWASKNITGRTE